MADTEQMQGIPMRESFAEFVQILRQENVNGAGRLFGGHIMGWMDEVSAVSARRYAKGPVTTAAAESIRFLRPAFANQTLTVRGRVVWTGRTSMDVYMTAEVESFAGERELIADGHFILVALDESEQRSRPIPPVIAETEEEAALLREAAERHQKK